MSGVAWLLGYLAVWFGALAAQAGFSFVHITDTHVPGSGSIATLKALIADVNSRSSRPAFIINTGDVTELGTEDEFTAYRDAIRDSLVPIHAVPGNHDVRWSPLGKEAFRRSCGPLYRSFDYGGCHFVLLDSSVVLEHWGHLDGAQLTWLRSDLRRVRRDTPVFVFMHHWFGRDKNNIDNADNLLKILGSHNVVAAFIGHGHSDIQWSINGIRCFMAKGLYQGSRHEVEIGNDAAHVFLVRGGSDAQRELIATLPLSDRRRPRPTVQMVVPKRPGLEQRRFSVAVGSHLENAVSGSWHVEGTSLRGTVVIEPGPEMKAERSFSTENLASGWYTLSVQIEFPEGQPYVLKHPFQVARSDDAVRQVWERPTASSIQGSPTLHDNTVYVGSFDGSVYALDARTGRLRWNRATGDSVFATPIVHGELVVVSSTDGHVYALDRKSGKVQWTYDTGSPLFATATVVANVVVVGGNKSIHGIAVSTGRPVWTVPAGSFFQSRAASDRGLAVLGGWDNALYCIEAASGRVVWKKEMGRTNGGRGRLSFYYSPAIASPTIADGRVYVCTNDGVLHCVRLDNGEDLWEARAPAGGDTFGYSSPLVIGERVYLGGLGEKGQGDCYALNARTGELIWRTSTGADNYDSSPTKVGELIAIGSVSGRVTWLDPADGRIAASYSPRAGFSFSTPAGNARMTYTAGMNGSLVALSTPTQRL